MFPVLYIVISSRGKIWVDVEGKPLGPFDEVEEACRGAVEAAHVFGDSTRIHEVMVRSGNGKYETVWSSAHDSYPPGDLLAKYRANDGDGGHRAIASQSTQAHKTATG